MLLKLYFIHFTIVNRVGLLWSPSDFFIVYVVCGLDGAQQYHFPHFYLSFWSYINWPTSNWFIPTQFLDKKQRIAPDDYLVLGPCRSRLTETKGFLLRSSSTYGRDWTCNENEILKLFQFLVPRQEKRNDDLKKNCKSHMCLLSFFLLYLELN